ncbi:hypothetical protein BDN70DRAFT_938802 [Pholiota conissans]|uniref:F-box domain-containing protein n=1 Tax=Pholiota conissans TaxID=109636 RepID=A0A9P6CS05_9AGAR|nr:hypothetical protein BDN70DRAFT_938802 [Pholiota conissans]
MASHGHLSPSSLSPIDKLPYDALREIFLHCVPTYPNVFDHIFETTPIILSHVCSSWRVVAHTSPRLWCYLSQTVAADNRNGQWMVPKQHVDLIRFWRSKHGTILPFIYMHIRSPESFEVEQLVDENAFSFILEYLASAQYLDVNEIIWDGLATRKVACPNLRTVVLQSDERNKRGIIPNLQLVMGLTATPPLERLSILSFILSQEYLLLSHGSWSSLTHVALQDVTISLRFWFDFMGRTPALRWAYLGIYEIEMDYENLIEYTPPQLCSLFIESGDVDLCDLFSNLYLPTLHTLSLSWRINLSWLNLEDSDVISKLPNVLKAAPNIKTLGLSEDFLPARDKWEGSDDSEMVSPSTPESSVGTTPLWTHTPHLTHLFFQNRFTTDTEEILERVDLYRSDCPIRKLTVVDEPLRDGTREIIPSQTLKFGEHGSEFERNILVEFDMKTLAEKAWDASQTWELVD